MASRFSLDDLCTALAPSFDVSRETRDRLARYAGLLEKWQPAQNLVAGATLQEMWRRHFLDSAQLAPLIVRYRSGQAPVLLDIGSGAGFPALVLAVLGVADVYMVEANQRKAAFLRTVARETSTNVTIYDQRIEDLAAFPVDIVTARACASVTQLLGWAWPFCHDETQAWLLKGEKADEELTEAAAMWKISVDRFDSVSDPRGVILRLQHISPRS